MSTTPGDEDLLTEDELAQALVEAEEIEAKKAKEYRYLQPEHGRRGDVDATLVQSAYVLLRTNQHAREEADDVHAAAVRSFNAFVLSVIRAGVPMTVVARALGVDRKQAYLYCDRAIEEEGRQARRERMGLG